MHTKLTYTPPPKKKKKKKKERKNEKHFLPLLEVVWRETGTEGRLLSTCKTCEQKKGLKKKKTRKEEKKGGKKETRYE